jgi:hypothetical protein
MATASWAVSIAAAIDAATASNSEDPTRDMVFTIVVRDAAE